MRNKGQEKRYRFYKEIVKACQPIFKKYGRQNVQRALSRWAISETKRKKLLKEKSLIEKELTSL